MRQNTLYKELFHKNMHITLWFTRNHTKNEIKGPVSKHLCGFFSKLKIDFTYVKNCKDATKQVRCLKFSQINFFSLSSISLKFQTQKMPGISPNQKIEDKSNDKAGKNLRPWYFNSNSIELLKTKQKSINWVIYASVY